MFSYDIAHGVAVSAYNLHKWIKTQRQCVLTGLKEWWFSLRTPCRGNEGPVDAPYGSSVPLLWISIGSRMPHKLVCLGNKL